MPSKSNPEAVKADAANILKVWQANPYFKLKDQTVEAFEAAAKKLETLLSNTNAKELELTALRNDRDHTTAELDEVCIRVRSGIKGYFGGDLTEYKQAGGTRASERKRPVRKNNQPANP